MFDDVAQALLLGSQLLDRTIECDQPFLRCSTLGLHPLLDLSNCRRSDLFLSFEVALAFLKDVDLLGQLLHFCSGTVEFGFCRAEISGGTIVGASRDTGGR